MSFQSSYFCSVHLPSLPSFPCSRRRKRKILTKRKTRRRRRRKRIPESITHSKKLQANMKADHEGGTNNVRENILPYLFVFFFFTSSSVFFTHLHAFFKRHVFFFWRKITLFLFSMQDEVSCGFSVAICCDLWVKIFHKLVKNIKSVKGGVKCRS